MRRAQEILREAIFSSGEAREFVGVPLPRFQDWLNRKVFPYTEIEQGERRLVRRFSGYDLMRLLTATTLMDEYGIEPSDAATIAEKVVLDISFEVFLRDWNRPEDKDLHPILEHEFWAISHGRAFPTFNSTTVFEIATEIVKAGSFIVIDTAPLKKRVFEAIIAKMAERTQPETGGTD